MKLKFEAHAAAQQYNINNKTINGIDLSVFPDGGKFIGDDDTKAAGIISVERIDGELYVTLIQACTTYQVPVYSHDWTEGEYIDSAEFSNDNCYIVATAKPVGTEYFKTEQGCWSVRSIQ